MQTPVIYRAIGFCKYTPNTENIVPFNFCTTYLTEDCFMNVTDHFDHDEDNVEFKAGYHPMMFKKIRSISNGSVYLCHKGKTPTLKELLT